jgi:eukaryotic-like serine/threonine-protein kinase
VSDILTDTLAALEEEGVNDAAAHFKAFRALQPDGDVDAFLQHLYRQRIIDETAYRAVHMSGAARVTGVFSRLRGDRRRLYQPVGDLGGGAMGQVYVAIEQNLHRKVAFKQVSKELQSDERLLRRFVAEVQITAQLDHPNIVPVYGLELTPEGSLGYAMKLVNGRTFDDVIEEAAERYTRGEKVDEAHERNERLSFFRRACEAVHYAHSRHVYHRDLKPANIMVGPYNEVYVMDWGLARVADQSELGPESSMEVPADGTIAAEGEAIGTPAYMAPEQAKGLSTRLHHLGPTSDQYALGLILQELVTLEPAINGKTTDEVMSLAKQGKRSPWVHYKKQKLPWQLKAIVEKACTRHFDQRYASVGALSEDVRRYLHDEPILAKPEGILRKLGRFMGRYRDVMAVLVLFCLASLLFVVIGAFLVVETVQTMADRRERRLGDVLTMVTTRGHVIDKELMRYERLIEALAAASTHVLQNADDGHSYDVFTSDDYKTNPPLDLLDSPFHRMPVSLEHPVFKLAPGVEERNVRPQLQKAARLSRQLRKTMLESHPVAPVWGTAEAKRALASDGTPIVWAYVGLAEGIHMSYPGHGGYDDQFDPRKRPWYTDAEKKNGVHWGSPYIDASGHGLMLPCSAALYSDDGGPLGVAGIDLSFRYIIDHMLQTDWVGARHYLVDADGRMVMDSEEGLETYEKRILENEAKPLNQFGVAEVSTAIQAGESGYVLADTPDGEHLFVYTQLDTLGWYYIVEGQMSSLLH